MNDNITYYKRLAGLYLMVTFLVVCIASFASHTIKQNPVKVVTECPN